MKNNLSAGAVKTYSNQTHMKHIFGLYMYREYLSPSYLINVSFLITYFSDQVIPKRYILVFFLLMLEDYSTLQEYIITGSFMMKNKIVLQNKKGGEALLPERENQNFSRI